MTKKTQKKYFKGRISNAKVYPTASLPKNHLVQDPKTPIKLALTVDQAARLLRALNLVIVIEALKPPYRVEISVQILHTILTTELEKHETTVEPL